MLDDTIMTPSLVTVTVASVGYIQSRVTLLLDVADSLRIGPS
jgi:hypothetical protein